MTQANKKSDLDIVVDILKRYVPNKTKEEVFKEYGFTSMENSTIFADRSCFFFFLFGGTDDGTIYPCGPTEFISEDHSIRMQLAFKSKTRTISVTIHLMLDSGSIIPLKNMFAYYNECSTDDMLKKLQN